MYSEEECCTGPPDKMRTEIIVLHRYAYGDSSWIVKALSLDLGILSLLVKGAKSKNSRFKASIDPLAHSEIEFRHNKNRGNSHLIIPKEVFLHNYFPNMRLNLQHLATAQLMAEILLKLGQEHNSKEEFKWLLGNLQFLDLHSVEKNSLSDWLHKLCDILGYAPRFLNEERSESFFLGHLKTHTGMLDNLRAYEWLQETRRIYAK